MRRVVAQGTFDILHPGHVHYLAEAKAMGDELHVIVARSTNVTHKPGPIVPGPQRVEMVEALKPVDHARLGHPDDIFVPIEEIEPAIIALGHDQHHDDDAIEAAAADRGIDLEVRRASPREATVGEDGEELLSTGRIIDRILEERG
jgi:FAD synthetase